MVKEEGICFSELQGAVLGEEAHVLGFLFFSAIFCCVCREENTFTLLCLPGKVKIHSLPPAQERGGRGVPSPGFS